MARQSNVQTNLENLKIYKRYLPHWRAENVVYFVTWRLHKCAALLDPHERTDVAAAIEFFNSERYCLAAYVVMDDHVHILLTLAANFTLEQIIHSWKSFTAHKWTRSGQRIRPVWEQEYFDRIVRDSEEMSRQLNYIMNNPIKRWPDISDYQWCRVYEC